MKKQNFFYTLLFCMMAMVVSFASCSDDDDSNNNSGDASSIVGTWADSEDSNDVYVFNSDGTFANYYYEDGKTWVYSGTYQYNASAKTLRITITNTNDPDDYDPKDTYRVTSISSNSITLVDSDGDPLVLIRTK